MKCIFVCVCVCGCNKIPGPVNETRDTYSALGSILAAVFASTNLAKDATRSRRNRSVALISLRATISPPPPSLSSQFLHVPYTEYFQVT